MTSVTDLREVVDVVPGVDAHVHTHSAAAVDTATGGVLGEIKRCLTRYVARDLYRLLENGAAAA